MAIHTIGGSSSTGLGNLLRNLDEQTRGDRFDAAFDEAERYLRAAVEPLVPHDTGTLKGAFYVRRTESAARSRFDPGPMRLEAGFDTAKAPYAAYPDLGTGIYGPRAGRYVSDGGYRSKAPGRKMRFFWRRYGAASVAGPPLGAVNKQMALYVVRGQPPQNFWERRAPELLRLARAAFLRRLYRRG